MVIEPAPNGTDFLYESAREASREQWQWIDAMDTKAGVLMAADGLIAGLVFTKDSLLWVAPTWLSVLIAVLLLGSLTAGLISFATRSYETAPDVGDLVSSSHLSNEQLRWRVVPDLLFSIAVNESKISQKANFLFYSGSMLLVGIALFGAYFVDNLIT